ncbi:hypothetical protein AGMMS49992_19580 [Clostridia bacterium]|nr:hypothetical protein AGMMS49992_19580 [Clostridia bacterium]
MDTPYDHVSSKEYIYEGLKQVQVGAILKELPSEGWIKASCGDGSKGARIYEWMHRNIGPTTQAGWSRTLLIRRGKNEKGEADYRGC